MRVQQAGCTNPASHGQKPQLLPGPAPFPQPRPPPSSPDFPISARMPRFCPPCTCGHTLALVLRPSWCPCWPHPRSELQLNPCPLLWPGRPHTTPTLGMLCSPGPLGPSPNIHTGATSGNFTTANQGQRSQKLPGGKNKKLTVKKKKKISQNDSEDCNTRSQRTGVRTPREGGLPPGILSHQCEVEKHPQTDMGSETLFPLFPLRNH